MADLNTTLLRLGVIMPLDRHPKQQGEIVDATGRKILQVDPDGMLPDYQANYIAVMIVLAVNTCSSFQMVAREEATDGR